MIIEVFKKGITINGTNFLHLFAFYQNDLLHAKLKIDDFNIKNCRVL